MTEKALTYVGDKFPQVLAVESNVMGIHFLMDPNSKHIAVSPSGQRLAYTKAGPLIKLTKRQAICVAREILGLLEDDEI